MVPSGWDAFWNVWTYRCLADAPINGTRRQQQGGLRLRVVGEGKKVASLTLATLFLGEWQFRVTGCRHDYVGSTTGVPQLADDCRVAQVGRVGSRADHEVCPRRRQLSPRADIALC